MEGATEQEMQAASRSLKRQENGLTLKPPEGSSPANTLTLAQ